MRIIPTQLKVEACIIECDAGEISIIIRGLYEYRCKYLKLVESATTPDDKARAEIELKRVDNLEKVLHSYVHIPLDVDGNAEQF